MTIFPEASKITCDVRIVNPLNAKTVYLVQVKEGPQILTFNLAGVKTCLLYTSDAADE